MDSNTTPPWNELPRDLILQIQSFLNSRIDHLHFRSICKSWRSYSTPKPFLFPNPQLRKIPILYLNPKPPNPVKKRYQFLTQSDIYLLSDPCKNSFMSSVVAFQERRNGKYRARHPISDIEFGKFRKVLDLMSVRAVRVGKLFHLNGWGFASYKRVVASLDDDDVVKESLSLGDKSFDLDSVLDVCVMGIFGEKLMRFSFKDRKWVMVIHAGPSFPYWDVIFRKGKFYAVDEARRIVIVDSMMHVEVVNSPDVLSVGLISNSDKSYLVNYGGDLHLVVLYYEGEDDIRDPFNTKFSIYRFKEVERGWARVTSLGDWSIFVSCCGSFGVCISEDSVLKKNCIYFQMDIQAVECSKLEVDKVCFTAVFDMAKGSCDEFTSDFSSPGSVITWNRLKCNI